MYKCCGKRLCDIIFSFLALVVLAPVIFVCAVLIRLKLGPPVLFSQPRPGLKGEVFKLYKFRSMTQKKDLKGQLLSDSDRLTPLGQYLRSTSADELPSLLNVLLGDMSLVGPRPLLVEYLPLYSTNQGRRHDVKPGITGLAQVNGRNNITWKKKFEYDVWYVDNISFSVDVKILIKTISKVILKADVNKESLVTTDTFNGHN
jgi:lipopolysaccharide/colanic/teichoic acid biosynthesis glycosyltransferase